jgi:hypothetical protein
MVRKEEKKYMDLRRYRVSNCESSIEERRRTTPITMAEKYASRIVEDGDCASASASASVVAIEKVALPDG